MATSPGAARCAIPCLRSARHAAWSDKRSRGRILTCPPGQGIDDLFTPEINSQVSGDPGGGDNTIQLEAVDGMVAALHVAQVYEQGFATRATSPMRRPSSGSRPL